MAQPKQLKDRASPRSAQRPKAKTALSPEQRWLEPIKKGYLSAVVDLHAVQGILEMTGIDLGKPFADIPMDIAPENSPTPLLATFKDLRDYHTRRYANLEHLSLTEFYESVGTLRYVMQEYRAVAEKTEMANNLVTYIDGALESLDELLGY